MIVTDIRDLFTIYGDFAEVEGAPTRCEDGYEFQNDIFFIKSSFFKHSSGVNRRSDTIKNISDHPVTITTALSKFTINGGEYEVYTQYNEHISEGQGAWAPLVTGVYGQSDEIRTNQDVNPFVALYNTQNQRGLVFHLMAESMFEYRVCRDAEFLGPRLVRVEMGIKSDNFSYTLAPNEELRLPDTLFYTFKSKLDLDAYKLHRYSNELYKKPLPIIYNSWMSHFDLMSYDSLMEQLKRASAIGCEYFTVDAGWFGETQKWWDVVGDWVEPEDCGMCGRLSEFATQVREFGLKFGLWFEIERSSKFSRSICEHSEHYIIPSGQHAYINFASSEAVDYIYAKLKACIDKYGVELIKFDLNAPLRFDSTRHAFIDFYRGFIEFLSRTSVNIPAFTFNAVLVVAGVCQCRSFPILIAFGQATITEFTNSLIFSSQLLFVCPAPFWKSGRLFAPLRALPHHTPLETQRSEFCLAQIVAGSVLKRQISNLSKMLFVVALLASAVI
ncbi:MAG: alpha-galactosidase [Clostridia bacterium]|nr:alpha-galactosidase [Clostridia bacterium]